MPSAGALVERVALEKRVDVQDEYGNTQGEWQEQWQRSAQLIMRPGSEATLAGALEGRQPVTIIVRSDPDTRKIEPDWRVRDVRAGTIYAIKAAADMDRRRQWISLICVAGDVP